jgi:hypothetical protein
MFCGSLFVPLYFIVWSLCCLSFSTTNVPEHLSSHPVFSGVRVTRSLVLCVCFVDRCLSFNLYFSANSGHHSYQSPSYRSREPYRGPYGLPLCCLFFFDLQILITSLWYLQTLLIQKQVIFMCTKFDIYVFIKSYFIF